MSRDPHFGAMELGLGSIKGQRAWMVDKLGRLRAVSANWVWRPGENVSDCPNPNLHGDDGMSSHACGFHAYYNGDNEYHADHTITGIIEGYGETVIGTKGFRSKKAKIVALVIPKPKAPPFIWPGMKWLNKNDRASFAAPFGFIFGLAAAIIGFIMAFFHPITIPTVLLPGIALLYIGIAAIQVDMGYLSKRTGDQPLTRETLDRVMHNYPDVEFFDTEKEMLAKHPLETEWGGVAGVTPESDPQFWEREAPV